MTNNEMMWTGMKGSLPMGYLAALGAFRHIAAFSPWGVARLSWRQQSGHWRPVLTTEQPCTPAEVLEFLVKRAGEQRERPELSWAEQIKKNDVDFYRKKAKALSGCKDWFAAFATELSVAKDRTIRSTAFDMTGGQQKFLLKLKQASDFLADNPKQAAALFDEALFGPWRYNAARKPAEAENSHSLGLDASTLMEGAFTSEEPAGVKDKRGIRGAIYLAFEALPLFPCVYENGQSTVGFRRADRRKTCFHWALWDAALTLESVRTLLSVPLEEQTSERGFVARYRAARVNLTKDYYTLGAAELYVPQQGRSARID